MLKSKYKTAKAVSWQRRLKRTEPQEKKKTRKPPYTTTPKQPPIDELQNNCYILPRKEKKLN